VSVGSLPATCCTYADAAAPATIEEDRVGFPDGVLTTDEEVVLHLHPHWRTAVRPILVLIVALTAMIVAWVMLPLNDGGRIGVRVIGAACLVFALAKGVWPLLVWRSTHYVFTDERILLQDGVLSRDRRDLPLARVNDHAMTQSLLDRMLGSGTMTIDSLGERGPAVLAAVPRIERVQTTLYELIEDDRDRHGDEDDDEPDVPDVPVERPPWRRRRES
jgi:uncharacterized membrane protein YdbT with pleckstrin-like domain